MDDVGVRELVPLLLVSRIERSLEFYVSGLGFRMTNQWNVDGRVRWCALQLGGATLMLQEFVPDPAHDRTWPARPGEGVSFNFVCRDAIASYHHMKSRGLAVKRPFVGNAAWVASITDPDGYELHFESPTDAPEESEYEG